MIFQTMVMSMRKVIIIQITAIIRKILVTVMNSSLKWDIAKKRTTMTSSCGVLFLLILLKWEQLVIIIMKL